MTSPLAQIDRLLDEWTARPARIDQNLVDLTAEPAYQRMENTSFEGATAARIGTAKAELEGLFDRRRLLTDVIDQARAIRATVTAFRHGHRLVEVESLLEGRSIELPPEVVPVTERGLLDADEVSRRATPAEVLEEMTASFDRVRDTVDEVATAWSSLTPVVDAAEAELNAVEGTCREAGSAVGAQYEQVRRTLTTARHLVETDPLGAAPAAVRVLPGNLAALKRTLTAGPRAVGPPGGSAGAG